MNVPALETPAPSRLLSQAIGELARRTRFPVAFGGLVENGQVAITAFHGRRTDALDGLTVAPERGLGGRSLVEKRPRMAGDYRTARQITHDYDRYILGEGIGTLIAVPVLVGGRAHGILYGASWGRWDVGGVVVAQAVCVAAEFAAALGRPLPSVGEDPPGSPDRSSSSPGPAGEAFPLPAAQREELRESYAELRRIASDVVDPGVRARLESVEKRLAALANISPEGHGSRSDIRLAPREIDVLACAALGATNAGIGNELGLREGTVKAYLSSAMSKLDAPTRFAAVTKARRVGILP